MNERIPRAVLDSNVIYSRVLHELMGRVAAQSRLIDLIWSDDLLDEAKRVLIDYKPLDPVIAERWVGYMRNSFPDGRIDISTIGDEINLEEMTPAEIRWIAIRQSRRSIATPRRN